MRYKYSFEGICSSVCLFIVLLIIFLQVLSRIFPVMSFVWTEELSRWVWIWVVCIGWGEVDRTNQHLSMDFIVKKLPLSVQKYRSVFLDILCVLVTIELIYIGIKQVIKSWHSMSVTLPFGRAFIYLALLVGLLFSLLRVIIRIVVRYRSSNEGKFSQEREEGDVI